MYSPNWDEEIGVCLKHKLPCVPCPACIAKKDEDIYFHLDGIEREELGFSIEDVNECLPEGFTNKTHNVY